MGEIGVATGEEQFESIKGAGFMAAATAKSWSPSRNQFSTRLTFPKQEPLEVVML